eukprot:scaffold30_cov416-Prasinococcus_capsulatus_cf.AAC.33
MPTRGLSFHEEDAPRTRRSTHRPLVGVVSVHLHFMLELFLVFTAVKPNQYSSIGVSSETRRCSSRLPMLTMLVFCARPSHCLSACQQTINHC